jgi:hypothetical protein
MGDHLTRREMLSGAACGAATLLFSRKISLAEAIAASQSPPPLGNAHLLTLVALSPKTIRLRVVQPGKQGPANEVGIVAGSSQRNRAPGRFGGESTWSISRSGHGE